MIILGRLHTLLHCNIIIYRNTNVYVTGELTLYECKSASDPSKSLQVTIPIIQTFKWFCKQVRINRQISPLYDENNFIDNNQVQVRTWPCGHYHPCICALVAREGNDAVQIDMCEKRKNQHAVPEVIVLSERGLDGTTLSRDRSGKKFFVLFSFHILYQLLHVRHRYLRKAKKRNGNLTYIQVPLNRGFKVKISQI
jgi:hypothetical protein